MATAIGAVAECRKNGADAALMVQMPPRDADRRTLVPINLFAHQSLSIRTAQFTLGQFNMFWTGPICFGCTKKANSSPITGICSLLSGVETGYPVTSFMEGAKSRSRTSAMSVEKFVSLMSPLIEMEKVSGFLIIAAILLLKLFDLDVYFLSDWAARDIQFLSRRL